MKPQEAFHKLQEAIMSAFDVLEDVEYREKLWMQVFRTMEKHMLVITEVRIGHNLPMKGTAQAAQPVPQPAPQPVPVQSPEEVANDADPEYPFGKYGGTPVSQLPLSYVRWAVENIEFSNPRFQVVKEALLARVKRAAGPTDTRDSRKVPY